MLNGESIYVELADQYKLMDATSNVPKRNALAQHLKEIVDILEQKVRSSFRDLVYLLTMSQGDQTASLYDLLTFKVKPLESIPPP
jgi:Centrosome microtubule-binding domain of Cep57